MSYADYPCKKAVTLLTDYMEGALTIDDRAALEQHLAWCDWCMTYFDQLRDTVRASRRLALDDPGTPVGEILAAFRRQGGSAPPQL